MHGRRGSCYDSIFSLKINLGRRRHVGQAASAGFGRQAASADRGSFQSRRPGAAEYAAQRMPWCRCGQRRAAFSTEAGKGMPFTASAAMMEAKMSPVPGPGFPCGVHPAAAVNAAGLCGIFISCGCAAAAGDKINEIFLLLHAGNHNPIRSHGMQPVRERCQFFRRPAGFPVRDVRQKAGLRNIGGDDIRQGKKLLHLCAVLRGDGAVGFSVITHDGIENYCGRADKAFDSCISIWETRKSLTIPICSTLPRKPQ